MAISSLIGRGIKFGGIPFLLTGGLRTGITQILPASLAPARTFGIPTLLNAGNNNQSNYTTFINGVDRSENVFVGVPVGPGITFNRQTASRAAATFTVYDETGSYIPQENDTVLIYELNELVYSGIVDTAIAIRIMSTNAVQTQVTCVDWGGLLDQRVFAKNYNIGFVDIFVIVKDILAAAADLGITLVWGPILNAQTSNIIFNYVTCTEALNQVGQIINAQWVVDAHKNLYFFSVDQGYTTDAPEQFLENSKNWMQFQITKSRTLFANKIYAKSSIALGAFQTDTWSVPPYLAIFPLSNTQTVTPTGTIDGVPCVIVNVADFPNGIYGPGAPPFDFYFSGALLCYNQTKPPLAPGTVVTATYPSQLISVAIAVDDVSIATRGLQEMIIEAGPIPDMATLQDIADGALANSDPVPGEVQIVTRSRGFNIRQLITVNILKPAVNGSFVITQITSREVTKKYFEHTITADAINIQKKANQARYFGMLLYRTRTPLDRIIQQLGFVVAGTIEGLTNPGLTTGVKNAIVVAQKDSLLGWISLTFKSIDDGILTTQDITINVFQNGVSVFSATSPASNLLLLRAGSTEAAYTQSFITNPLQIKKGDKFTFQVVTADPLAMDGALDIVGVG